MQPVEPAVAALIDALLAGGAPDPATAPPGLTRLDVWARLAAGWIELGGPAEVAERLLPGLLEPVLAAPDPDLATLSLARLDAQRGGLGLPRSIAADPRFGHDLLYLLGLGSWTAAALQRDPGLVDLLLDGDALAAPFDAPALAHSLERALRGLRLGEHRLDALRRWKRAQFLRVIVHDRLWHRPQQEVTQAISQVADRAVGAALRLAAGELLALPDEAPLPAGLALIAMGKWGSLELNYNSDIDLLCVFEPVAGGVGVDDWTAVVQRLTVMLSESTAEGAVFRVDHRLRPEGETGPLVRSLESCAAYYPQHGQAWEAQALTRARFCAGDEAVGRRFERLAQQTAYGTRLSRAGVALIRRNRSRLDERDRDGRNVKEGRGGIRDIEFTSQLLQLVRGVTDPSVRRRNTWDALEALTAAGALTERERQVLAEAYDFLRQTEHLLQLQPTAPTKLLPTDPEALERLARALGYRRTGARSAADRFRDAYRSHTDTARALCERLFYNPVPLASPDADAHMAELLDPLQPAEEVVEHLAAVGFAEPLAARRRLLFLAHGEPPMRLPESIQALFVELLPALLACIQRMPDPDAALRWFERFISRAGGREPFYRFLAEHPPLIELLCRVGGFSDMLSQMLVDYPEYLNHVVNPGFLTADLTPDELEAELAERLRPLATLELRLDDLRRFRRREAFRTGVRDLVEAIPTERVTRDLSLLAELVLRRLLVEVVAAVPEAEALPLAIIGCGKLGGRELHYSSDLDVLFVYEPGDLGQRAPTVADRVARELTHRAELRTRAGWLYELDARLRPHGGNSPLARSLTGYQRYYEQQAQPWERLALTRVRAVAGDPAVGAAFIELAHAFAFGTPLGAEQLHELRVVKRRVETERRDPGDRAHLDLKLEPGGLMDLEFLVQILQVRHGGANPRLRSPSTAEALERLAAAGVLPAEQAAALRRAYRFYRRLETRLQLVTERPSGLLPLDGPGLAAAARRLGRAVREGAARPEQLVADVRERQRVVREIYESIIGLAE